MTLKDVLPWLLPTIITVVIAAVNIVILVGQRKQTQTQICIDLMEKRVKIYYEVLAFLCPFIGGEKVDNNMIKELRYNTRDVEFLFGDEIYKFITEIVMVAKDYILKQGKISEAQKKNQNDEKYQELLDQQETLTKKLSSYIVDDIVLKNFNPYLDFRDYKLPRK